MGDPGEVNSLGRPYYRAVLSDIGLCMDMEVNPLGMNAVKKYEEALEKSEKEDVKLRVLM